MITFIVATDFKAAANNAMRYALNLGKAMNARIVLFHLYQLSGHAASALVSAPEVEAQRKEKIDRAQQFIKELSEDSGLEVLLEVRLGDFMEEVQSVIAMYIASLLVLGMPEKSFEQDLLGAVIPGAVYKLKFPVLSVPQSVQFNGISKILYACDRRRGIHGSVSAKIKEYAERFNAFVEVFYVGGIIDKIEELPEWKDDWEHINYTYKNVQSDSVINAIKDEVKQMNADLLIMTPHRYGFWASLIHRSKTRAMAASSDVPLLSIAY